MHTVGEALGGQRAEHVFGGRASEHHAVQARTVESGQPELDGGDGDDAARHTHHAGCCAERRTLDDRVVDRVADHRNRVGEFLGARRVGVQLGLGEAHRAEGQRHALEHVGVAEREFGRCSADVDHERGAVDAREARHRAVPREAGFVVAREQPRHRAGATLHLGEEFLGVLRHAARCGARDRDECVVLAEARGIAVDDGERASDGSG